MTTNLVVTKRLDYTQQSTENEKTNWSLFVVISMVFNHVTRDRHID